ncbi:pleckstrin homology-like domain family A member 2 [Clupea harengus]|uniref:Pleckstrin homology-like domain family A member 2 n=1 Tax=Clupea harengus TaxID=7950 RepID=A0A6P3W495_CLUHA|nr:pleckstrin homology-like domain family A member 2 [Clupea harengus]
MTSGGLDESLPGIKIELPSMFIHNAVLDCHAVQKRLLYRGLRKKLQGILGTFNPVIYCQSTETNTLDAAKTMKMSASETSKVLKEGELEKRSDNLLQFWRRKTCVLTADSLNIYADTQKKTKGKELQLQSIKKVDCVERTGKFVYFTIVTMDNKEIDFRCSGDDNCWNAVITMALIDFQNRKAIEDFKTRQDPENTIPSQQERQMVRAP